MRVCVLGAGAIGTTTAFELASRGADVTLYEQGEIASGSSGRAAGLCYDAYADPIDARIGDQALTRFHEISDEENEFTFNRCPYIWMARKDDEKRATAIREHVTRMQANGRNVSLIDTATLTEQYPSLHIDDIEVAAIARNAGYTDPETYTRVIANKANEEGATIRSHSPAILRSTSVIETPDGRELFDAVLVAAGASAKRVLVDADISIPLKPYRVQALTTEPTTLDVPMLFDASGGYYLRPHGDGLLVGDGTEPIERDPNDWKHAADEWFIEATDTYLETAIGTTLATERAWAGLCTATPDSNPLLGEIAPDVFVATGWHGHGFMRAPALGETIAEQILGSDGIPAFDPNRFDGNEEFEIREGMDADTQL